MTPSSSCVVAAADCGERYEWPATFSASCRIGVLDCGASWLRLVARSPCTVAQLRCAGVEVTADTVTVLRQADLCAVTRRPCSANDSCVGTLSLSLHCPTSLASDWLRVCDSPLTCTWQRKPCTDGCTVPNRCGSTYAHPRVALTPPLRATASPCATVRCRCYLPRVEQYARLIVSTRLFSPCPRASRFACA